jgi:DNA polymerase
MKYVFLDFESFWSSDYTLNKLTPIAYVMDPRWEMQSLTICIGRRGTARTAIGLQEIMALVATVDWSDAYVIAHNNAGFDAWVAAYRLGIRPAMWGCTLEMARPLYKRTVGLGLGKLVEHFGIGIKNNKILIQTKGRYLREFTPQEIAEMRVYNADDTLQCREIFFRLLPEYDREELFQIDLLIRMRVEPAFVADMQVLEQAAVAERQRKHESLLVLGEMLGFEADDWGNVSNEATDEDLAEQVRAELASTTRFAKLLESLGVQVPMKKSNSGDYLIPALAKTDQAFIALQDSDNEVVATAARVRLDVKSTQLETRIATFQQVANATGGLVPIPLLYCGAITTGRDSGTDNMNAQNLPRITPGVPMPADALRNCLTAPPGYVIIVADQSGIELRINHFLWKVRRTMALYAADANADLYKANAARAHGIAEDEVTKPLRQTEKIKQLGLGFGAGGETFVRVAKTMGGLTLTLAEAIEHVDNWRADHTEIAGRDGGWNRCNLALEWIDQGIEAQVDPWGLVYTCREGFVLPSNRLIRYPNLRQLDDGTWPDGRPKRSWFYGDRQYKARVHGPKADENIVQALGRDSLFDVSMEYFQDTGWRPKLRVHDELVYMVPERDAQDLLSHLQSLLRKPPKWWPELITWSEGNIATRYGDAK